MGAGRSRQFAKFKQEDFVKRKASDKRIRKVWRELKNVRAVAKRISYTVCGTYRALHRLGIK